MPVVVDISLDLPLNYRFCMLPNTIYCIKSEEILHELVWYIPVITNGVYNKSFHILNRVKPMQRSSVYLHLLLHNYMNYAI